MISKILVLTNNKYLYPTGYNTIGYNESGKDSFDLQEVCVKAFNGTLEGPLCGEQPYVADVFLFSCLLFIGTFTISMALKEFKSMPFFTNKVYNVLNISIYNNLYSFHIFYYKIYLIFYYKTPKGLSTEFSILNNDLIYYNSCFLFKS